jgi:hypothetical protein
MVPASEAQQILGAEAVVVSWVPTEQNVSLVRKYYHLAQGLEFVRYEIVWASAEMALSDSLLAHQDSLR